MKTILYILRIIYRIRLWLVGVPLVVTLLAIFFTRHMVKSYEVNSTIYTGVASGYSIESNTVTVDWNMINNEIDNIINIIYSQTTLHRVSLRLYARNMINGNPDKDNNYITAAHYRQLVAITPKDVQALIVKNGPDAEEQTVANLMAYERPDPDNFVFGLFNWNHPHYSFKFLSKIQVRRMSNSDMLDIHYTADDPGIAYNTLLILNDEFRNQYHDLRFAETNNVIEYFRQQLKETQAKLLSQEDSLTDYSTRWKVINYGEQTKHIAALTRDYELNYEGILREYRSSEALVDELNDRMEETVAQLMRNSLFNAKLNNISDLTTKITTMEAFFTDSLSTSNYAADLKNLKAQLKNAEDDLMAFSVPYAAQRYSKEGVPNQEIITQWLEETLKNVKAEAELNVMKQRRQELDEQYTYYAPIGPELKRRERDISLTEKSYLEVLDALHTALMKQKNLQMSSASLKVLNPPIFPISSMPTARKLIVAAAFFGSLLFVLGFFLILELLDRTLRDKIRAERITGMKVIGAFLGQGKLKYRGYNKECYRIASNFIGNAAMSFLDSSKPRNIVNILSTEDGNGKEFLASKLEEQWTALGFKVRVLSWHNELMANPKKYQHAHSVAELYEAGNEDIVIVEQPPLRVSNVPADLLNEASLNILTARADKVWKDTDQLLTERLRQQIEGDTLYLYLTQSERETVEYFTGMLPPFTPLRKLIYRMFQLGLTSKA